MSDSRDLTRGSTHWQLIRLAGPMIVGIAAVMSMSIVDAYFIGKVSSRQLAAISYTFPVILTLQSLAIGLGAGAASVVSRAYGSGKRNEIERLATDSLILGLLIVGILGAIAWFSTEALFTWLGAQGEILAFVISYMRIWYLGLPLLVIPQIANAILRAGGDSFVPSVIMVSAAVVNAILDPLLILGLAGFPRLEIVGAAWASFAVRAVTLILSMGILVYREKLLTVVWPGFKRLVGSWEAILRVAIPAGFGSTINPIGVALVTSLLSAYSASTVAGFGVATRIEAFVAIPMFALSAAIGPFAGQNWTSDNRQRVKRALVISYTFCLMWSALVGLCLWFTAELLARQFSDDQAVTAEVALYLKIVPFSLAGYGIVTIAAGCFNAIDHANHSLVFYLSRTALFYVPLSALASWVAEAEWVYTAIACANVLSGVLTVLLSLRWLAQARCGQTPGLHTIMTPPC